MSRYKRVVRERISVASLIVLILSCTARAQSPFPAWEQAAGAKMSFDVASVKQNTSDQPGSFNVPLGPGDSYPPNGGLFSAMNMPLSLYVGFAYKLTPGQTQSLNSQLPKWALQDRFDIEARGTANATKDQMRLMMQSLLASRFGLAVHTNVQRRAVLALVLIKPGKLGPQMIPHTAKSPPCGSSKLSPSETLPNGLPSACGAFLTLLDGHVRASARNVSMNTLAAFLTAPLADLDRPVIDRTGLRGAFDLSLDWVPLLPTGAKAEEVETGPTLVGALRDQLGLKLQQTTGPVEMLIIDRIAKPSPN